MRLCPAKAEPRPFAHPTSVSIPLSKNQPAIYPSSSDHHHHHQHHHLTPPSCSHFTSPSPLLTHSCLHPHSIRRSSWQHSPLLGISNYADTSSNVSSPTALHVCGRVKGGNVSRLALHDLVHMPWHSRPPRWSTGGRITDPSRVRRENRCLRTHVHRVNPSVLIQISLRNLARFID